jgi:hypothetical protein
MRLWAQDPKGTISHEGTRVSQCHQVRWLHESLRMAGRLPTRVLHGGNQGQLLGHPVHSCPSYIRGDSLARAPACRHHT